jgi:hypothetical protein
MKGRHKTKFPSEDFAVNSGAVRYQPTRVNAAAHPAASVWWFFSGIGIATYVRAIWLEPRRRDLVGADTNAICLVFWRAPNLKE